MFQLRSYFCSLNMLLHSFMGCPVFMVLLNKEIMLGLQIRDTMNMTGILNTILSSLALHNPSNQHNLGGCPLLYPILRSPAPALLWDRAERIYLNTVLQPQCQHIIQPEMRSCYSHLFTFFLNLNKTRGGKCSNEIAPAYVSNSWWIKIKFYLSSTTCNELWIQRCCQFA